MFPTRMDERPLSLRYKCRLGLENDDFYSVRAENEGYFKSESTFKQVYPTTGRLRYATEKAPLYDMPLLGNIFRSPTLLLHPETGDGSSAYDWILTS